jgi:nucleotide-binding universal stress UspA family protein
MKLMEPQVAFSLKNILLAVDFFPESEAAIRYARSLARACSSNVQMIHADGPDSYRLLCAEAFRIAITNDRALDDRLVSLVETLMDGLPNETPLMQGDVSKVIGDVISRNKIDLVVLGTHGRRGVSKFIWGSIAEQIFRSAWCPVLTVGPAAQPINEGACFQKILLASDLNPDSAAPLYASWLRSQFGGALTALHVVDEKSEKDGDDARKMKQLESLIGLDRSTTYCAVEHGSPVTKILETIESVRPDVAVLGVRHPFKSGIGTHSPWSTATSVISEAQCPVLTIRELR